MNQWQDITPLLLAARVREGAHPLFVGVCGSQGSGKSTLAEQLKRTFEETHGLRVAVLSLDDLYFPSSERERLARDVHPLLRTRGVPGTHDVELGLKVIRDLLRSTPGSVTRLPRFNKAVDEPFPTEQWDEFRGHADLMIFEGWCVGAVPQGKSDLDEPINELERRCDPDGIWRRYVNTQLANSYRLLFASIKCLVMLRAPSFDVVYEWRREQECKLEASSQPLAPSQRVRVMGDAELKDFIAHYERLTRHIIAEMPGRADIVINLDPKRVIMSIESRRPSMPGCRPRA